MPVKPPTNRLPRARRRGGAVALALVSAGLSLVMAAPAAADAPGNPLRGKRQFLDCEASMEQNAPKYNPWYHARRYRRLGQFGNARLIEKIAKVPQVKWFAGNSIRPTPTRMVERFLARVDDPKWGGPQCNTPLPQGQRDAYVGDFPVMAIRAMKHDSCKGYDGGGAWNRYNGGLYRPWIDKFVAQLGRTWAGPKRYEFWGSTTWPSSYFRSMRRRGVVIIEPDALGLIGRRSSCLTKTARATRLALLTYAAKKLARLGPGITTYIDVGSSAWLSPGEAVNLLVKAGVRFVRGFALNSTHFNYTSKEIAYGNRIARALGGKHYVVNTAENANGALPRSQWKRIGGVPSSKSMWCNPRNSGLGTQPTTRTASPYADAYLWISRPGISSNGKNGRSECGRGPLDNVWWDVRALEEARQASFASPFWPPRPL
jgi:endoglucanase